MDLAQMLQAVGALQEARSGADFVLFDPRVVHGLLCVLSADEISFTDLDLDLGGGHLGTAPPSAICADTGADSKVFRDTRTSCDTECIRATGPTRLGTDLAMPLPGPPGIARCLTFSRGSDSPFVEEDRGAAVLLQPHIADALRVQSHRAAAGLLTRRQHELLRLVATGEDNVAIARQLRLSPTTVRTHLENAFARLGVSSRTSAVARLWPDVTWH
jgi:DNA-binding CsgD family transcriptional regulator